MKRIMLLLPLVFVLSLCSFKTESEEKENNYLQNGDSQNEITQIYDELLSTVKDWNLEGSFDISGIDEMLEDIRETVRGKKIKETAVRTLFCAVLLSLASVFGGMLGENDGAVGATVSVILSVPALTLMKEAIHSASAGISSGSELFAALIPTSVSAIAVGTGAATSSLASAGLSITLSFVSRIFLGAMIIAAELIFAFGMIGSIDRSTVGAGLGRGVRNFFGITAGISSALLLGSISVSTAVSAVGDSVALRGARYAASYAIPIVGSTVSGALGALISGVRSLSVSIGALGAAALIGVMAKPIIQLLIYKITLGACSLLCDFTGSSYGQRMFSSVSLAIDALIAALSLSTTLYILEITMLMNVLKGVL